MPKTRRTDTTPDAPRPPTRAMPTGCEGSRQNRGTARRNDPSTSEEPSGVFCPGCRTRVPRLSRSYWGSELCRECAVIDADERDREGTWPTPWWEEPRAPHVAVLSDAGLHWRDRVTPWRPASLDSLGRLCASWAIDQVWVHESALESLGLPARIDTGSRGPIHDSWIMDRGGLEGPPGLRPWAYYFATGGRGFDLHVPVWGRSVWQECTSGAELLAYVSMFDRATKGCAWKGNGTITSDVWLRQHRGRRIGPTPLPPPVESGEAHEVAAVWHRAPTAEEAGRAWLHSFDLNLAYCAAASSLELPTGGYTHQAFPMFDPRLPGVYLVEDEQGARWVTAPTMARLAGEGAEALEGYVWHQHGRHLRGWYEMLRDARAELLAAGGPALEAVKAICREGLGRLASKARTHELSTDPTYQPYWAWAVIAEARERVLTRAASVGAVAVDTDALYVFSDDPMPYRAGELLGLPMGDGLGQFKVAGSAEGLAAVEMLAGARSSRVLRGLREVVK